MFCAKCGAPLNGAAFCSACGTSVNNVPVESPAPFGAPAPVGTASPAPGVPAGPKTNTLALVGFILSLALFCFPLAGLVLGIIGLSQINKSNGAQGGKGLAIAAIAISGSMMLFTAITYVTQLATIPQY